MIPLSIQVDLDTAIPVEQVAGLEDLGHWDDTGEVVRLREDQPEEQKLLVLMHEMMHMAESQVLCAGVLGWIYSVLFRRSVGEYIVENMSTRMFQWMACSGMLSGINKEDAMKWISEYVAENGGTT